MLDKEGLNAQQIMDLLILGAVLLGLLTAIIREIIKRDDSK